MINQPPLLDQATQLLRQGSYPEAITLLEKIVAATPEAPEPRLQLAKACLGWVQNHAQIAIMELDPESLDDPGKQRLQKAVNELQILADRHPSFPHVQSFLSILHMVYGRSKDAERCVYAALRMAPSDPNELYNLAYVLMELNHLDEAITQFARLTALHPEHGMGWQMLGLCNLRMGRAEAALLAHQKARELLPDWFQPYGGIGYALRDLGRYPEAMAILREGLDKFPENWDLNWAMASLALATEKWETGWRYYACRTSTNRRLPFETGYQIPLPSARPVKIHFDQGLGDELFFLRFVPGLIAQGMQVEYTTQAKLYPLLKGRSEFTKLQIDPPGETGEYDLLVGDLPYLTGMHTTAEIPPSLHLTLDSAKVVSLAKQLKAFGPPPYMGVTWQGGTTRKKGAKTLRRVLLKEISPTTLGKLAQSWPGTVVVLQRIPDTDALTEFAHALGRDFLDWSHLNNDLTDMLAGLSLMDEYVGVSNTNMHLLAGIEKVARVLVPFPPEWRWMAAGDESPWFPGFHIYRQALDLSWDEALSRLSENLTDQYGRRD